MKKFLIILAIFLLCPTCMAVECKSASECLIIGKALVGQKEYLPAIECFSRTIDMDSEEFIAYAYRAKAKFYLQDYEGMMDDTTKSLEIEPNPLAYGLRGSAKLALGDNRGSIDDTSSALELNPEYMKCYEVRARAEINLEDYISALEDSTRAIKLKNDYPKSYDVRARAQMGLKDYRSAMKDFTTASELFYNKDDRKNAKLMLKMAKSCKRQIK